MLAKILNFIFHSSKSTLSMQAPFKMSWMVQCVRFQKLSRIRRYIWHSQNFRLPSYIKFVYRLTNSIWNHEFKLFKETQLYALLKKKNTIKSDNLLIIFWWKWNAYKSLQKKYVPCSQLYPVWGCSENCFEVPLGFCFEEEEDLVWHVQRPCNFGLFI